MIILELHNNIGMGNQLYLYARAFSLAKETKQNIFILSRMNEKNRPFILDKFSLDSGIVENVFRLDGIKCRLLWIFASKICKNIWRFIPNLYYYKEPIGSNREFTNIPYDKKNYWISGNFECYKYFHQYRKDLVNQFRPSFIVSMWAKNIINRITEDENSVALHIRRGDFVNVGRCIPIQYYDNAINYFLTINSQSNFYLVTEDEGIKNYYKKNKRVISVSIDSYEKDIEEWLCLLACKNHIITNSTFSWWAAYLSERKGKKVIIPDKDTFFYAEKTVSGYENFYPKDWISLKNM